MDPLFTVGSFLIGGAAGYVLGCIRAGEACELELCGMRERVRRIEEGLTELEQEQQPNIEARMLERMFRK